MIKNSENITAKRLTFIQNHPLYLSADRRLQELEETRVFCRHQMNHLLDVARIAYILNLEMKLGISRDLIYAAALLHDIGKGRQYEEGIPHETASADLAEQILADMPAKLAFTSEEQQQISRRSGDTAGFAATRNRWRLFSIRVIRCPGHASPVLPNHNATGVTTRRIWRFNYDHWEQSI